MDTESHIIRQYRIQAAGMSLQVLLLHGGNPKETRIEDRVHEESDNVQGDKVEIQSDNTLSPVIDDDLWVEGHGPGHKVDPPDDIGHAGDDIRYGDSDTEKYALDGTVNGNRAKKQQLQMIRDAELAKWNSISVRTRCMDIIYDYCRYNTHSPFGDV